MCRRPVWHEPGDHVHGRRGCDGAELSEAVANVSGVRSSVSLASGPGFRLDVVTCVDDHRRWSAPEVSDRYRVVLVRRGVFRRMTRGRAVVSDPTMAYIGLPGEEERFAHPAGGDVCTSLSLSPGLWRTLTSAMPLHDGARTSGDSGPAFAAPAFYVDARLDLAHRRVLRAARDGDIAYELPETLMLLLRAALAPATSAGDGAPSHVTAAPTRRTAAGPGAQAGPRGEAPAMISAQVAGRTHAALTPSQAPRREDAVTASRVAGRMDAGVTLSRAAGRMDAVGIVGAAREAFAADVPETATLTSLAAYLGVSPYTLSRAFTRELGVSLTHYRNRVRVGRALDRLEDGAPSLAELAADLGFADQAHLTRTIRRHVGHTPTAVRRLLGARLP